jgi:hypothetical protein
MITKASEKGQALVLVTLAAIGLFAFAALAIDGSMIFSDKRHAQNAADTAALEAALTKTRGGDWAIEGLGRADSNGYDNNGTTNDVLIYSPPIDGVYLGNDEYVQVKIRSDVNVFFARVIGFQTITNRVEAVARATPSYYDEMFSGNAVVGLAPHECSAVKYQGAADATITGGGIFVMSDCDNGAFFNNSNNPNVKLTAPSLCAVGDIEASAIDIPSVGEGCKPPPRVAEPNPPCSGTAKKTGNTLSPGSWSGQFPPPGVDTLESGIYCVDGNFQMNGGDSLTGHGVVIRMNGGFVKWNGGAEIHLSAPAEGPWKGLLLYMPSSTNCSTITLNGNSYSTIVGTIMAPCSDITVQGTGDSGIEGQIVGYTVEISGSSETKIHYSDEKNYDSLILPTIEEAQ